MSIFFAFGIYMIRDCKFIIYKIILSVFQHTKEEIFGERDKIGGSWKDPNPQTILILDRVSQKSPLYSNPFTLVLPLLTQKSLDPDSLLSKFHHQQQIHLGIIHMLQI